MASSSASVFLAQLRADVLQPPCHDAADFMKNKLESLKLKSASERCPALVDVARTAGVSVAFPQGGWLTKSALVEALASALSSAASVSSASSLRSAADAFLAELRDMVQQRPGDGATSVREKLLRLQARGNIFSSLCEIRLFHLR